MHPLLTQQLQRRLGKDFLPDAAWRDLLEDVSATYVAFVQSHAEEGAPSKHLLHGGNGYAFTHTEQELSNQYALLHRVINSVPDLIFFKNLEGVYLGCNVAFEEYVGAREQAIIGKTDFDLMDIATAAAVRRTEQQALELDAPSSSESWVVYPDGRRVCLEIVKAPFAGVGGEVLGLIGMGRDITERKRMEQSLREEEKKFRLLFESANDCLVILDGSGRIVDINPAGYERLGCAKEEMVGKPIADFNHPDFVAQMPERMAEIRDHGVAIFETAHLHKDGSAMPVEVNARVVEIDGERRVFAVIRDITERKRLKEQLQLAALTYQTSSESMMVTGPDNRIIAVNPAFTRVTGYTEQEVIGQNPRILQSGRQDAAFYKAMWNTLVRTGHWQGEIWNRRKNGEIFPEWLTIDTIRNADGSVHRNVALFYDITEKKSTEARLQQEKQFSDDIINTLPEIFYMLDEEGKYVRVNQRFLETTGYSMQELSGMSMVSLFDAHEGNLFAEQIRNCFDGGPLNADAQILTRSGRRIPYHFSGHQTRIDGRPYLIGLGTDTSERKAHEEALVLQANTDSLTGLATRRHFLERVSQELGRAQRYGGPTSMILLDLDEFKAINDNNGHQVGDEVLKALGDICRSTLRSVDVAGRLGGEEFAILLPETNGSQAMEVAERLRKNIAETVVYVKNGKPVQFTASMGVETLCDATLDIDRLLSNADLALYNAKRSGRNKVCAALS
jgi:diguanylate cyclase (GGDEF)-like protein/PAS domain S-box-containing protein